MILDQAILQGHTPIRESGFRIKIGTFKKNMKRTIQSLALLIFALLATNALAFEVKSGIKIKDVDSQMKENKYSSTTAQMGTSLEGGDQKFYNVGQGILIVTYLKSDMTVKRISYYLSSDEDKSSRTMFFLAVTSFNPKTGQMSILIDTK